MTDFGKTSIYNRVVYVIKMGLPITTMGFYLYPIGSIRAERCVERMKKY